MQKFRVLVNVVILGMWLHGCAPSIFEIANRNRESLNHLSVGMTREDVLRVMGASTVEARVVGPFGRFPVSNPYRSESATTKDGETIEVLLYCTDVNGSEFSVSDDELTPIVLKEGHVVGWGRTFYDQAVQRYEVRIR